MSGYVYCAYNELFKENLYKIGKAKKLKNRLDQLSRDTGVPSKFKLLIATKTENYERLEREVFKILRPFRLPRKEFFQLEGKLDHNFLEGLFSNLDGETIYPNNKSQEEFTSNNSKRTYSIPPFSFKKVNIEIGETSFRLSRNTHHLLADWFFELAFGIFLLVESSISFGL